MRFSCSYSKLVAYLDDIAGVVEDSLVQEDAKNVIMRIAKDEEENISVSFMGISSQIIFRRFIEPEDYQLDLNPGDLNSDGIMLLMFKSKDMRGALGTYKSVRTTKVEDVILEVVHAKLQVVVEETRIYSEEQMMELMAQPDGEDIIARRYPSKWMLDMLTVKPAQLSTINLQAGDVEVTAFQKEFLQLHLQNLLPIVTSGTTAYSYVNFGEDFIIAQAASLHVLMKNRITEGGIFTNIRLVHRCFAFLDKLVTAASSIEVAKLDKYLYIRTENSESFLRYENRAVIPPTILKTFTRDHVVTVDRIYLKDVLKRFSYRNDTILTTLKPEEGVLHVANSVIEQDLTINFQRGLEELSGLSFRVMPSVIDRAIIGSDDKFIMPDVQYGGDVFFYFCKGVKDYALVFSDASGGWHSVCTVKIS